jgi:hypothetical protein
VDSLAASGDRITYTEEGTAEIKLEKSAAEPGGLNI